jgi:hypothetical protein
MIKNMKLKYLINLFLVILMVGCTKAPKTNKTKIRRHHWRSLVHPHYANLIFSRAETLLPYPSPSLELPSNKGEVKVFRPYKYSVITQQK